MRLIDFPTSFHLFILAIFLSALCSCSVSKPDQKNCLNTSMEKSCLFTDSSIATQYKLIYLTDNEAYGEPSLSSTELAERAVELNKAETQVIKECIQFYSLWNKPAPTFPSNWYWNEVYWVMSNEKKTFVIGEHGENALIGLMSPFFWNNARNELKDAMKRAKAKAMRPIKD